MTMLKRVVIVGGGFGGLWTARSLAKAKVEVVLVDRENHHLFQPLLYQVATAGLSPSDIAVPIRSVFRRYPNVRVLLGDVENVDAATKNVLLRGGEKLSYDYLVIAVGAKTTYYGHDAWSPNAFGLKSVREAIAIREKILVSFEEAEKSYDAEQRKRLLTFAVIGGGPTGVELAGAISELGRQVLAADFRSIAPADIRVVLIEMGARVLSSFPESLSAKAKTQLEELCVEIRMNTRVTNVTKAGVELDGVLLPASVVCWAAGVRPQPLGEQIGFELNRHGQIVVDEFCRVPNAPNVFAIGDVASFTPQGQTVALPGLAPVAIQQGRLVAHNIERDMRGVALKPFVYIDKGTMATIGRSRAVALSHAIQLSGFVAWVAWLFVHLWFLIGFRNRFLVLFNWFWAYATFRRGARLITHSHDARTLNAPPNKNAQLGGKEAPGVLKNTA